VAPLKPANDAVIVDTSDMSIDEVVQKIDVLIKENTSG
jgi:cytidylate kinase